MGEQSASMRQEPAARETLLRTEFWEQYTRRVSGGDTHVAHVYVRSLSPPLGARQAQEVVLERLQALEDAGTFDAVELEVVGEQLCTESVATELETTESVLDHVGDIREWTNCECAAADVFEERTIHSRITGEAYETLRTPRVLLTVSVDDRMVGVFPCLAADTCVSVVDYLDLLADRTGSGREDTDEARPKGTPL